MGEVHAILEKALCEKTGINIHQGKTKSWNKAGIKPSMTNGLTCAARLVDPDAFVLRGDWALPPSQEGFKVLGVPIGHPSFITAHMAAKFKEQVLLFERILLIDDVQVGWLLFIFCATTRANTSEYAEQHDQSVLRCLSSILQMDGLPPQTHEAASMFLTMGGLGVGGCSRIRHAAHWASWADCLEMVKD